MLVRVFSDEIITVNIITHKIVCVGYPATIIFWVFAILNVNTSGIKSTVHPVNYLYFYILAARPIVYVYVTFFNLALTLEL